MESHIADITHAIQLAVAPVFLLTAIATLINVLSSRLSRVVDRRRFLHSHRADSPDDDTELALLDRRRKMIYFSIFFAVLAALLVCLVVAGAFLGALLAFAVAEVIAGLFVLAMTAMIVALSLFLREVYLAVRADSERRR